MTGRRPRRSGGAVLLAALVMLVVLMLGASALMRMVESASLLSGNLAFKRAATLAAEAGTEAAIGWLAQQDAATLAQDQPAHGYYADDAKDFDGSGNRSGSGLTRVDWQGKGCGDPKPARCLTPAALPAQDAAGHTVRYVMQRLCASAGPHAATGGCAFHVPDQAESTSRSGLSYSRSQRLAGAPLAFYRITAHASGPRHTVSVIEVLVRY